MKSLTCPRCKTAIGPENVKDGRAVCPGCDARLTLRSSGSSRKPNQGATPAQVGSGTAGTPAASAPPSAPPSTPDLNAAVPPSLPPVAAAAPPPAPVGSIQVKAGAGNAKARKKKSDLEKWLPWGIGGVIVLVGGILGMVALMAGPDKETATVTPGNQTSPGQQGSSGTATGDDEFDLNDLTTLDDLTPLETPKRATSSPSAQATPRGAEAGYPWPAEVKLISVPIGGVPSIDGVPQVSLVATGLAASPLLLPAPPGLHVVRLTGEQSSTPTQSTGFPKFYESQLAKYGGADRLDYSKLAQAAVAVDGVYRDPILPHCLGNYYWQSGKPDAAVRFWKLAVVVSPAFAPAHLNLAFAAKERGDADVAKHELALAQALNIQDSFGISGNLMQLGDEVGFASSNRRYAAGDYMPGDKVSGKQREVINVLLSLRDLATSTADRAACLNNIGVYLLHECNAPGDSVGFFQHSRLELADESSTRANAMSSTILSNLVSAAESAGFAEADLYRKLASSRK